MVFGVSCYTQCQITSCSRRVCVCFFCFTFALLFVVFSVSLSLTGARVFLFILYVVFILFINAFCFDLIEMQMRKSRNFRCATLQIISRALAKVIFFVIGVDNVVVIVIATSQEHHLLYFTLLHISHENFKYTKYIKKSNSNNSLMIQ